MLNQVLYAIEKVLRTAKAPAVMCSFGKDSMLLLWLVRKFCKTAPVIWLHQDLMPAQETFPHKIIADWDLTVFTLAPAQRYLVPAATGEWSVITEHVFSDAPFPLVRDLVHDDRRCVIKIERERSVGVEWPFDVIFVGWKDCDNHPLVGRIPYPPNGTPMHGARWYAPLRDLDDAQVWYLIRLNGVPYNTAKYQDSDDKSDPDCVVACSRCVTKEGRVFCPDAGAEIDSIAWDRTQQRESFIQRFFGGSV